MIAYISLFVFILRKLVNKVTKSVCKSVNTFFYRVLRNARYANRIKRRVNTMAIRTKFFSDFLFFLARRRFLLDCDISPSSCTDLI